MHFTQLLPCIIASASVAVAQLIPVGPIVSLPLSSWARCEADDYSDR